MLFDAPDHTVGPILDFIAKESLELIGLWFTHGHFDHVADHKVVRDRFPAARHLIHALDEPKLRKPGSAMFRLPFEIPPGKADGLIADGEVLLIGQIRVEAMHTPGHSPGHVCFYLRDEKVLIGGDLIIGGAIGRTDLPDADEVAMEASLRRVMTLDDETQLMPGHGEITTIGEERRTNPFVRRLHR